MFEIRSFECPKSIRNYEKKNTWNIRPLVAESFVGPSEMGSRGAIAPLHILEKNAYVKKCHFGNFSERAGMALSFRCLFVLFDKLV